VNDGLLCVVIPAEAGIQMFFWIPACAHISHPLQACAAYSPHCNCRNDSALWNAQLLSSQSKLCNYKDFYSGSPIEHSGAASKSMAASLQNKSSWAIMTTPPSEGILFAQGLEGPTYASRRTLTEPPASLWRRPCKTEVPEPSWLSHL